MKNSYWKAILLIVLCIILAGTAMVYIGNARRNQMNSELFDATLAGDNNRVKVLLEHGANGDAVTSGSSGFAARGGTSLIEAAGQGHDDIVKSLLARGANIESKTTMGITPLIVAAMKGHASTVKLLLSKGANPRVKHKLGRTALDETLYHEAFYQKRRSLRPDNSDFAETVRLLKQAVTKK